MEYQKITNLLNKTNDQSLKLRTRQWVEMIRIIRRTPADGNSKDVEIVVPWKYMRNL